MMIANSAGTNVEICYHDLINDVDMEDNHTVLETEFETGTEFDWARYLSTSTPPYVE
jgi:hypothetical protein